MDRILGVIEGDQPGPLIICIAGIHGNEQIGLHAFRNVYSSILNHQIPFRGKLIGIAGNLKAIASNIRYLDYDLNRCWDSETLNAILGGKHPDLAENEEVLALHAIIEEASKGDWPLRVLADLHATSADNGNFVVVPEKESEHPVIRSLHLPVVTGLESYLKGTILAHYYVRGFVAFAFEGGTIGSQESFRLHTSGLWEILDKSGAITRHDHELEDHYMNHLEEVGEKLPRKVEIVYRHQISKGDGFRMLPGFHNFQPIHKGQLVAMDEKGEILSKMDGLIFMPLYQATGEDGFFVVQEQSN